MVNSYMKWLCPENSVNSYDVQYESMVGKAVCSDVCPCSGALFADWKVNDVQARNYSRTLVQTPAEKNEQV